MSTIFSLLVSPLLLACLSRAADNGLAITPQMGWDNWNAFGCDVSESLLASTAERIVSLGLRDLGYQYVVLDDCWSSGRSRGTNGTLEANTAKFPRGMAAVADDLHALGLKFGMYSDAGRYTCGGYEGSLGHEQADAATLAGWGVDYLKYDNCYNEGQAGNQLISRSRYAVMSEALNATGRPVLYSLCNWGEDYPWNWGSTIANSWRISGDVYDSFDRPDDRCPCDGPDAYDCALPGFHCSTLNIINKAAFIVSKAQKGAWNDLDMLTVGLGGQTDAEYIAHFSMWSAAKSPLLMGNDFSKISNRSLSILANAAVIAVNQDPQGQSAARRWHYATDDVDEYDQGSIQMWSGGLASTTGGDEQDYVVVLLNGNNSTTTMNATLGDVFVDSGTAGTAAQAARAWEVRDLWAYRITDEEAQALIDGANGTVSGNATTNGSSRLFNATETSYAEGLSKGNELLLGKVTTTVAPHGTITATVERHGAAMFRLRAVPTAGIRKRTEL
ncbi:Alpha-galactosidase [Pleurostoma richardsiae]|uniref:Alpha-galactosidase n=1 Tax=Pleurostoma richardsiae TaxID=41990 RepID=A0AA38RB69_9PEZI|nr:Alpha-galactosidase [Pleurostoma richardsiae]